MSKLTALQVKNQSEPGMYADSNGLNLKVTPTGSKSWIIRYTINGKRSMAGLGAYPDVSLAEARERAAAHRAKIRGGISPVEEKKTQRAAARAEQGKGIMTFDQCVEKYFEAFSSSWRNEKVRNQWKTPLNDYASAIIGARDVSKIEIDHILAILKPIWYVKAPTAGRVRQRIEAILDWARVMKFRTGDNPARWKGNLEFLLPARDRSSTTRHHPALPFAQLPVFMEALRQIDTNSARAVEFGILTAARSGEVRLATWDEIDEQAGLWVIPALRMKMQRDHRVTLSPRALEIVGQMKARAMNDYIFPGMRENKPLGHSTFESTLDNMSKQRMKSGGEAWLDEKTGEAITMHGFRSTFKDWARETTSFDRDLVEIAMAHSVGDKTEAAYARGSMIEKRKTLMQDWANYCYGVTK